MFADRATRWLRVLGVTALVLLGAASRASAAGLTIVDTDFGVPPIDDSFALALALASPGVHVVAVTTVAGNQKLAIENAQLRYVLERLHATDVLVYAGPAAPPDPPPAYRAFLAGPRPSYFSSDASAARAVPDGTVRIRSEPAGAFIARYVLAHPGRVTIVCIGPLTNIAAAIATDPRVAHAIRALYIGGGYVRSDPDASATTGLPDQYAEFNFWVDTAAAAAVLHSGAHIVVVPYNVNQRTPFSLAEYRTIAAGRTRFAALVRAFAPQMPVWSGTPALMFDEDVVAAMIDPRVTGSHRVTLDVNDRPGPAFGESVARAPDSRAVTVLWHPDAGAIRTLVARGLTSQRTNTSPAAAQPISATAAQPHAIARRELRHAPINARSDASRTITAISGTAAKPLNTADQ
jgi:purine nucleosidase